MAKVHKQGAVTITDNDNGTHEVKITLYALSLAATRSEGETRIIEHVAFSSDALSKEDAIADGTKQALEKWPASQGWETDVKIQAINLKIDIG